MGRAIFRGKQISRLWIQLGIAQTHVETIPEQNRPPSGNTPVPPPKKKNTKKCTWKKK